MPMMGRLMLSALVPVDRRRAEMGGCGRANGEVDMRRVEVEHKSERRRGDMNECPCS